ncbi:helix-turn-helix domain-containing protein [Paenibacillus shunpengii]|uniref:Helix-turn-helix domain-containing protein n=1 Tax=Paenibacillus shunpengii TaxID=2054424 RepID=A0ABW5SRB2_9BACL
MKTDKPYGIYGFRFTEALQYPFCYLYAVGFDKINHTDYYWNGLERTDGPLFLIQYTTEGQGMFRLNEQAFEMTSGSAFLAEIPGTHEYYWSEGNEPWEFYFLLIRPALIAPFWEEIKQKLGSVPSLPPVSRPVKLLREIYTEARAGRITDPYHASSLVYQFILELSRYASHEHKHRDGWPDSIRLAVDYLESNYDQIISLDQLASELHISKYHLLRLFSRTVGMTPNEYLNKIRLERAVELLRRPDLSVAQVAEAAGFSSSSYFIRVFHHKTGHTPGSFRERDHRLNYDRLFFD